MIECNQAANKGAKYSEIKTLAGKDLEVNIEVGSDGFVKITIDDTGLTAQQKTNIRNYLATKYPSATVS